MNFPAQFISSAGQSACARNPLLPGIGRARGVNNKEKPSKPHETFVTAGNRPSVMQSSEGTYIYEICSTCFSLPKILEKYEDY
jgi:hypothetical protein